MHDAERPAEHPVQPHLPLVVALDVAGRIRESVDATLCTMRPSNGSILKSTNLDRKWRKSLGVRAVNFRIVRQWRKVWKRCSCRSFLRLDALREHPARSRESQAGADCGPPGRLARRGGNRTRMASYRVFWGRDSCGLVSRSLGGGGGGGGALAVAIACGLFFGTLEGGVRGDSVAWGRGGLVPGGPRLPFLTLGLRGGGAAAERSPPASKPQGQKHRPSALGLELDDISQDSRGEESGGSVARVSKRTRSPDDTSGRSASTFPTSRGGMSGSELWWSGSESRFGEPKLGKEVHASHQP